MTMPNCITTFTTSAGVVRAFDTLNKILPKLPSYLLYLFSLITGIIYIGVGILAVVYVKIPTLFPVELLKYICKYIIDNLNVLLMIGYIFAMLGISTFAYLCYKIFINFTQSQVKPQTTTSELESLIKSEIKNVLTSISSSEKSITSLLSGDNVRIFEDPETMYEYLLERYKKVKISINMTHFGDKAYRIRQDEKLNSNANSRFYNLLNQIILEGKIRVNRVVLVRSDDSLNWIKEMMQEFKDKPNLSIGCYPNKTHHIYLTSLMILDSEEVLMTYGEKMLEDHRRTLSIKSPLAAKFFQEYFNCLLRDSTVVKSETVNNEKFVQLQKKYGTLNK
jgi:hypothetical protein